MVKLILLGFMLLAFCNAMAGDLFQHNTCATAVKEANTVVNNLNKRITSKCRADCNRGIEAQSVCDSCIGQVVQKKDLSDLKAKFVNILNRCEYENNN